MDVDESQRALSTPRNFISVFSTVAFASLYHSAEKTLIKLKRNKEFFGECLKNIIPGYHAVITFENRLVLVISLSLDEMAGNDNGYLICKMAAFKPLKS